MTDFSHLIFSAQELDLQASIAALHQFGCVLIQQVFPFAVVSEFNRRAEYIFHLRNAQLQQQTLPEVYAMHYPYGYVNFLPVAEVDGPGEQPNQLLRLFEASALVEIISGYFRSNLLIGLFNTVLRQQSPERPQLLIPFHQDGPVLFHSHWPALNCWIPLSGCGVDAPGLQVIPVGLKTMLRTQTQAEAQDLNLYSGMTIPEEEIESHFQVSDFWHPLFEPGDVLIFNHWTPHRTLVRPTMTQARTSIEMRLIAETNVPEAYREESFKQVMGSWF